MSQTNNIFNNFDWSQLSNAEFKEDSVREVIIMPLLNELGYSDNKNADYTIKRSITLKENFIKSGSRNIELANIYTDYVLYYKNKPFFVLEAKKPSANSENNDYIAQAFYYAIHPELQCQFFGICNGHYLNIYNIQRQCLTRIDLKFYHNQWHELQKYLKFQTNNLYKPNETIRDYTQNEVPPAYIKERKRAVKRHFGVHGYFTRQSWDVVQEYIKHFSNDGDVVFDPFGGSGITAVEALMLNRRGIHLDLNPLSCFMVDGLTKPVNLQEYQKQINKIEKAFEIFVASGYKFTPPPNSEFKLTDYYPTDLKLPKGSDVPTVRGLFNDQQLNELAFIKYSIMQIKDKNIQTSLLLAFSSTLNKINLTYHHSEWASENAGNSAPMLYYRYRIAKNPTNLSTIKTFKAKASNLFKAKQEISPRINNHTINNLQILRGDATNITQLANESVDYIYTDPPYGKKIPYLDLSTMWNAWLGFDVSVDDFAKEAIEGGSLNKSKNLYGDLIVKSIVEMFRVLKWNRWLSIVFQHQDPYFWTLIVDNAEKIGFEFAGVIRQENGQTSFKKRQNPYSVISGQMIINFKKVANPFARMKADFGADITALVLNHIESIIAEYNGATMEQICADLVVYGLENGYYHLLADKYEDVIPILNNNFECDEQTKKYHIKKYQPFKTHLPLEIRVRYFTESYLRLCERTKQYPSLNDIVREILPKLKNGISPQEQHIIEILNKIAYKYGDDKWRIINDDKQLTFKI